MRKLLLSVLFLQICGVSSASSRELYMQAEEAYKSGEMTRARELYSQAASEGSDAARLVLQFMGPSQTMPNAEQPKTSSRSVRKTETPASSQKPDTKASVNPETAYNLALRAKDKGNLKEAVKFYRIAAKRGHAKAMLALGQSYLNGSGIAQDFIEAHLWLNLAASEGELEALSLRDDLASRMSAEQIAEAQKKAADFSPKQ